jgi:hypothetical protein
MKALFGIFLALAMTGAFAQSLATYGQHQPHGQGAVNYLYGADGTWRSQSGLSYHWNWYNHCASSRPSADTDLTIGGVLYPHMLDYTDTYNHTSPDANCILQFDLDNDGEISDHVIAGNAFVEHTGKSVNGALSKPPHYQFWFDDNWLARYMAIAYARPQPVGLHDFGYSLRWRQMGGDNSYWTPYHPADARDKVALNGIYQINSGNTTAALTNFQQFYLAEAGTYDWTDQRYEYPAVNETYHLALMAILAERLLALNPDMSNGDVLQHAQSLRSNLLTLQERTCGLGCGTRLGWRSDRNNTASLINTETTAAAVLALGANARNVLEPGISPLLRCTTCNYFVRQQGMLSAVVGLSTADYMVYGPNWNLPVGNYAVEFNLRIPTYVSGPIAYLDVTNGLTPLSAVTIYGANMPIPPNNRWRRFRIPFSVTGANSTQFRVYWYGGVNLDVGQVRLIVQ